MDEAELAIMERMSTSPWVHKLVKEVRRLQGNITQLHGIEQAWEEYADELDNLLDEGCEVSNAVEVLLAENDLSGRYESRRLHKWLNRVGEFHMKKEEQNGSD